MSRNGLLRKLRGGIWGKNPIVFKTTNEECVYAYKKAVYPVCRNEDILCRRLQRAVDSILQWMSRCRLEISTEKCAVVRFTYRFRRAPTSITVDGLVLPWSLTCRYLNQRLSRRQHLCHIRESLHRKKGSTSALG